MFKQKFLRGFLLFFLGFLSVLPMVLAQPLFFQNSLLKKPAADFTLETLAGREVNLTQERRGRPAVLFFWATWCPHCREVLKDLTLMADNLESEELCVLIINEGEERAVVEAYVRQNKIKADILLDVSSSLAEPYGIIGVPTFFFIDRSGTIIRVAHEWPLDVAQILKE